MRIDAWHEDEGRDELDSSAVRSERSSASFCLRAAENASSDMVSVGLWIMRSSVRISIEQVYWARAGAESWKKDAAKDASKRDDVQGQDVPNLDRCRLGRREFMPAHETAILETTFRVPSTAATL